MTGWDPKSDMVYTIKRVALESWYQEAGEKRFYGIVDSLSRSLLPNTTHYLNLITNREKGHVHYHT